MSKKGWITEKRWITKKRWIIKVLLPLWGMVIWGMVITTFPAGACLGARPLAMGGAFVAVCNDAHASYWNPAGLALLAQQEHPYQFTAMYTINNREYINYQEWFSYVQPYLDFLGLGISYVHEKSEYYVDTTPTLHRDSGWLTSSVGFSFNPRWAMGWNIREYLNEWRWKNQSTLSSALSLDLGALYQLTPKVRLGILIQDINQPVETFSFPSGEGFSLRYGMNIRPGIAYFPDPTTIIALDIYYFTLANVGEDWQSEVRVGIEKWIADNLALRAGFYGWDFQTLGAGYRWEMAGFQLQIDYALLASNPVYGVAGTHMLSVGAKF